MSSAVTDQQIQDLAATAQPFSIVMLSWTSQRHQEGADAVELEHQRRMVSLHADGVIAVLCPIQHEERAGMAILTMPADEAHRLMAEDPCVRAGMMTHEVFSCVGFPGDSIPG